ncbi:Fructosamine kinase-domain-containing protein [Diaporthe sp. PMI_573]|nr:Fructosamine kinase-domain-containing protein [Diaporthaceae sp. PMI_573]
MAEDSRMVDNRLDEAVLEHLPGDGKVIQVTELGLSDYCRNHRIDLERPDGSVAHFFTKTGSGPTGLEQIESHWVSESMIHKFIPEYVPEPIAFDKYRSEPDTFFMLMEFVEMIDDIAPPDMYMAPLAKLYARSLGQSPTGKFGFPVNTTFGFLPQTNDWEASWEVWWTKHMKMILERDETIRGEFTSDERITVEDFLNKVLPRYLRPLETGGRSIQPCLCHTNMWPGNVKFRLDNEALITFDANAVWGHHEFELGVHSNPRYPLGKSYINEYFKHVPISQPEEDVEHRILIYLIRNQVCLANLYPQEQNLRDLYIENMRLLVRSAEISGTMSDAVGN